MTLKERVERLERDMRYMDGRVHEVESAVEMIQCPPDIEEEVPLGKVYVVMEAIEPTTKGTDRYLANYDRVEGIKKGRFLIPTEWTSDAYSAVRFSYRKAREICEHLLRTSKGWGWASVQRLYDNDEEAEEEAEEEDEG